MESGRHPQYCPCNACLERKRLKNTKEGTKKEGTKEAAKKDIKTHAYTDFSFPPECKKGQWQYITRDFADKRKLQDEGWRIVGQGCLRVHHPFSGAACSQYRYVVFAAKKVEHW